MRRVSVLSVSLLALAAIAWPATSIAQETKTARGTVTAMAADSLTVKVGANDMKFAVDAQTTVVAPGAGTRQRRGDVKLADVVKTGQAVMVNYRETAGTMHATRVQVVSSAGPRGGGASAAAPAAKTGRGKVKSVSATSLTITGADGKDMMFTIDPATNVVARGASTAGRASGGKIVITDAVKTGDTVTVSYHDMAGTLHAANVRVTSR